MMKTRLLILSLAVIAGFAGFAAAQNEKFERVLTEADSIRSALAINPDILIQSQNIDMAQQRINEAHSLYLPRIDVNFNLSKFESHQDMVLYGQSVPAPVFLPSGIQKYYFATRVAVWQDLYSGGRVRTTNKLAEINMQKVRNDEVMVKNRVIFEVKTAFNSSLYFKELIKFYKTKPQTQEVKNKIEMAELNFSKELLGLLSAVGLELDTIADVTGDFTARIVNIDLNKSLLLAYRYKPEIQMAQYRETVDSLSANLLSQRKYPVVSLGAAQEWTGEQILSDASNWYLMVNVNIPVFDGGGMLARARQGSIQARNTALERSKTEDAVRLEVSRAFLEYSFWKRKALERNLMNKKTGFNEEELEIIYNLNRSYFSLELAVGVQLDSY